MPASQEIVARAAARYGLRAQDLQPLSGGHLAGVYACSLAGKECVLRITPPNEEMTARSVLATLAWLEHAAARGGAVTVPVRSAGGRLIEELAGTEGTYLVTGWVRARGRAAQGIPIEAWSGTAIGALGRAVGRLHALAAEYRPADASLRRPEWTEVGNCFLPVSVRRGDEEIGARGRALLARLEGLPRGPDAYGLIHTDLHLGNVCVDPRDATVTILDWDDCSYGWFVMDVALTFFDALVLWPQEQSPGGLERFARHYLAGYREERTLGTAQLGWLPLFLSLLEVGVYTQVCGQAGADDTWVARFLRGRRERILAGAPYADLDWAGLAGAV